MQLRIAGVALTLATVVLAAAVPAAGQETSPRPQIVSGQSLTIAAEVVAFDPATRKVKLKGPLGGEISAVVAPEVKDVSVLTPGSLASITYYAAIAASVRRKGEERPLFSAADAAARAQPGMPAEYKASASETYTVVSVDLVNYSVLFRAADGTLLPTDVLRPEFREKLKDLRVDDQVDMTYSEAIVTGVSPVKAGEEAKITMKAGTLVVDRGEVVKRMNDVLMIRNERGRMLRVQVDTDFKFLLDGKEATVYDVKEGTKLSRTAIRVRSVSYSD